MHITVKENHMNRSASYVHALNGRLRIKLPGLKGNPGKAQEIENRCSLLTGLHQVSANPVTGRLLFTYDPRLLKQEEIGAVLREMGYFQDHSGEQISILGSASSTHGVVEKITTTLASGLMEIALTRLVGALL
jgi:hypothetical protein